MKKMYLILREDLAYKYIQGSHALAEFALANPILFKKWGNQYLICVSVFNGRDLIRLHNKLVKKHNFKFSAFREPDLDYQVTALCFYCFNKRYEGIVKKLHLASK
jgi:hypothetical protein